MADETWEPSEVELGVTKDGDRIPVDYLADLYREFLQGQTMGFSDELGSAVAAGIAMIKDGVSYGDAYRDIVDTVRYEQAQFREENPGAAFTANLAGGLVSYGGGALATQAPKTTAAAIGGASGLGFSDSADPQEKAIAAGAGALMGVGGQVILSRASGTVARWLKTKFARGGTPLTDDSGRVTNEAIDALEEAMIRGEVSPDDVAVFTNEIQDVLTPEQLRRMQLFQRRGVTPVRANLTQTTDDFRNLQDTVKRSGPVAETLARQDEQMSRTVQDAVDNIRPRSQNLVETNANVYQVVDDVVGESEDAVTAAYRAAREAAKGERVVSYDNLVRVLRENLGRENLSGGIPSALRNDLKNWGVLTKGWKARGKTDVLTAEEIRKGLNDMYDPANPRGNALIRTLKDALDEDVAAVAGDDVFEGARQSKISLQRLIERGRRDRRDATRGGFLEDVLNNKIPEEKIVPKLLSGRDDDFLKFKAFLTEDAGAAGVQAWDDIRAQVLRDAWESAISTQGKREGGQAVFNSRIFNNAFKNLRKSKKFDELFTPGERQLIEDMVEIGRLRVPMSNVQQGSGPTGVAVNELREAVSQRLDHHGNTLERVMNYLLVRGEQNRQLNPARETEQVLRQVRQ